VATDSAVRAALSETAAYDTVEEIGAVIRVEDL
jgi:hypothetical protein